MCSLRVAAYRIARTSDLRQAFPTEILVAEIVPLIFRHPTSNICFHLCQRHILLGTTAVHITSPFVRWLRETWSCSAPASGRVGKTTPCSRKGRGHSYTQPLLIGLEYGQKPKPAILCLQKPPILIILMSMRNQSLCFSSYLKDGDSISDSTRQLDVLQRQSQGEKPPLRCLRQCATCSPC